MAYFTLSVLKRSVQFSRGWMDGAKPFSSDQFSSLQTALSLQCLLGQLSTIDRSIERWIASQPRTSCTPLLSPALLSIHLLLSPAAALLLVM